MSGRLLAADVSLLAARALWVYGGAAVVVAAFAQTGERPLAGGASASLPAVAAVVLLSHVLARSLQRSETGHAAVRVWGSLLSLALFYAVMRLDITGEADVWKLGWLLRLITEPGQALEGQAAAVAESLLLGCAWLYGTARGLRNSDFETALGEVGLGLVVVAAAVAAAAAGGPAHLSWLPVAYVPAGLIALALAHLASLEPAKSSPEHRPRGPLAGAGSLWIVVIPAALAVLGALAADIQAPPLPDLTGGLAWLARGLALAVFYALWPLLIALAWAVEHLHSWIGGEGQPLNRGLPAAGEPAAPAADGGSSGLPAPLAYVLRSGAVVAVIAIVLAALWSVFQRFSSSSGAVGAGELVERAPASAGPSLLARALGRLSAFGGAGTRGRDPIGRLYFAMLHRAARQGLRRPPSATPLEFAPSLREHFRSPLALAISEAYARARYGGRAPPPQEIARLRSQWRELSPSA
ncbi:MAG: DUF4129 domain-containing protein [Dehalococcoidia bacterium]|nr:DUF4129 domain-containing protein [Dehalococcoidia bacterium]